MFGWFKKTPDPIDALIAEKGVRADGQRRQWVQADDSLRVQSEARRRIAADLKANAVKFDTQDVTTIAPLRRVK